MASSSSDDRLGGWLTEAYGILSNIKSIVTDTATAQTASASATATGSSTLAASATPSSIASSASASQTASSKASAAASSTATKPTVAAGSATSSIGQSPSITSGSSPSSTAAAAGGSGHSDLLPIILGTVLGGVGLICLLLTIWLCCRRKRRSTKSRRMASPDDDEIHSWRPDRAATQPMMGTTAAAWSDNNNNNNPPRMTQHPAYRGIETGSSNPFVPPVPAPRRSIQHPSPALAKETSPVSPVEMGDHTDPAASSSVGASSSATNNSADRHHHDPLSAGVAGLAAGVAAHKIRRKPLRQDSASPDLSSPIDAHTGTTMGHGNSRSGYGHARGPSSTPLMSGEQPRSYTQDRPPTPLGLLGFIKGATAARTAAANKPHHIGDDEPMSPVTPNAVHPDRDSYESFTLRDTPAYSVAQSHPAPTASRNSRRVSFNDHPESSTTPGSYRGSPVPGASTNSAIGYSDYAYPLPTSHHTNSSSSNSSGSPHNSYNGNGNAAGHGYGAYNPHAYNAYNAYNGSSSDSSNGGYHTPPTSYGNSPPNLNPNDNRHGSPGRHAPLPSQMANTNTAPRERRLRLSDLRAREEELERLKEEEGWEEPDAYGQHGAAGGHGHGHGVGMAL